MDDINVNKIIVPNKVALVKKILDILLVTKMAEKLDYYA